VTADAPETARRVLSEEEAAAVRRGVPDPGIPLPTIALPTLALWVASVALWVGAAAAALAALDGGISRWWLVATVPAHALVTFTMFTVLHEATHHAAGRLRWVNEVLGRLSMPFVAAWATFPLVRYIHIEHHRHTTTPSPTPRSPRAASWPARPARRARPWRSTTTAADATLTSWASRRRRGQGGRAVPWARTSSSTATTCTAPPACTAGCRRRP
jgi:fatty acid desaturase